MTQRIEVHMFSSQWYDLSIFFMNHYVNHRLNSILFRRFLTLFTARFPLPFVFQCIDLFLLDGINVLFQIGFALLQGTFIFDHLITELQPNSFFKQFAKRTC